MAGHLLKAGFQVTVYDVQASAVAALVAQGARTASSPQEVARHSEVVVVMVINDEQAEEVVAGPEGILRGAGPGTLVLLCSSLLPSTVRKLAALAKQQRVEVLDAPVTGGESGAQEGKLAFYLGGDAGAVQRITPVLKAMGPHVVHVGPVGSGQVVKTVNNILLWTTLAATKEVLEMAARDGVAVDDVRRAMQVAPANNQWLRNWWNLSSAPWIAKDLSNAMAFAEELELSMPATAIARELLKGWQRPHPPQ
jgi:3-hydroxyisobutyrate dehydrogenase-like beta-hydroxyacid dehydrogenase